MGSPEKRADLTTVSTPEKLDLKKRLRHLYGPTARRVDVVDVPSMNFLAVDGRGDPNTSAEYAAAVEALFSLSYAVKFAVKKGPVGVDYGVMPLEGLWWADDLSDFVSGERSGWRWTMMIMQPEFVTPEVIEEVAAAVAKKKPDLASLASVRFEAFEEGSAAQTLHVGPFSAEGPTIERVHEFITGSGRSLSGKHHEIYLSDIRRADPATWRTVIRQPFS